MRVVSIGEYSVCRHYRSTAPLEGLRRLGHEVVFCESPARNFDRITNDPRQIAGCDVILAYRMLFANIALVQQGIADGAALVWDSDDDLANWPRDSVNYKHLGRDGVAHLMAHITRLARMADVVTTTTPDLAQKLRRLGARRVVVIENHLPDGFVPKEVRPRTDDAVTIGWVAADEHRGDAKRVPIVKALRRLLAERPEVRVESAGVRLPLPSDRYRHQSWVDIARLPALFAGWDIGIAPLANTPFNRARSDVKLKEYGASALPWLASPVGPYLGKTEAQGGRLVPDWEWHAALNALISDPETRRILGSRALAWAQTQTMSHAATRWEAACTEAVERRRARAA